MLDTHFFTLNEAAILAETDLDFVHKAVEDDAVDIVYERAGSRKRRMVDATGVITIAVLAEADIPLPKSAKRNVFAFLSKRKDLVADLAELDDPILLESYRRHDAGKKAADFQGLLREGHSHLFLIIPISDHLFIDARTRMVRTLTRLNSYARNRGEWIVHDPEIKGGTPVVKGTRMTVYSIEGRVTHGDSLQDIAGENPDIPAEALEAAVYYARAHPLVGRPGGKPWRPT